MPTTEVHTICFHTRDAVERDDSSLTFEMPGLRTGAAKVALGMVFSFGGGYRGGRSNMGDRPDDRKPWHKFNIYTGATDERTMAQHLQVLLTTV